MRSDVNNIPVLLIDSYGHGYSDPLPFCAIQNDVASATQTYTGYARPGSLTSAPVWAIKLTTYDVSANLVSVKWAGGSNYFNGIWDNHASLKYS